MKKHKYCIFQHKLLYTHAVHYKQIFIHIFCKINNTILSTNHWSLQGKWTVWHWRVDKFLECNAMGDILLLWSRPASSVTMKAPSLVSYLAPACLIYPSEWTMGALRLGTARSFSCPYLTQQDPRLNCRYLPQPDPPLVSTWHSRTGCLSLLDTAGSAACLYLTQQDRLLVSTEHGTVCSHYFKLLLISIFLC